MSSPDRWPNYSSSGFPTTTLARTSHPVTVTAVDAFGNRVAGYVGTISFASTDGRATLPKSYTFKRGDRGSHTFLATLRILGRQSISAQDVDSPALRGAENGILVTSLTPTVTPDLPTAVTNQPVTFVLSANEPARLRIRNTHSSSTGTATGGPIKP